MQNLCSKLIVEGDGTVCDQIIASASRTSHSLALLSCYPIDTQLTTFSDLTDVRLV